MAVRLSSARSGNQLIVHLTRNMEYYFGLGAIVGLRAIADKVEA
ncbi:hypothetical protein PT974_03610 [Cladobotryum mycophilum]|uniref:Uncharacterized protein n=1 Tax=Cladobotryum mycophilum TaxID=491253 RepID=A0ABR0SSU5_9HYPO